MNCKPSPFRCLHPLASHSIRSLSFSLSGSHILCAPGDAICRIYDMDGNKCQVLNSQ
jgi:WD40 repeat protein